MKTPSNLPGPPSAAQIWNSASKTASIWILWMTPLTSSSAPTFTNTFRMPERLLEEIHRVLRPGICYFAAGNRLAVREPHYGLLFLSYLPRTAADAYLRWSRKGSVYYETHRTVWGLRRLVRRFTVIDYTPRLIETPSLFGLNYLVQEGTRRHRLAKFAVRHFLLALSDIHMATTKRGLPE